MIKPLSHDDEILLEGILDRSSTAQIVNTLAKICAEKADRVNWQDYSTAARWNTRGLKLSRISESLTLEN